MRQPSNGRCATTMLALLAAAPVLFGGCTRSKYRTQADRDAYRVIGERNCDPRWAEPNYGIEIDPRSRYYDAYDPDHPPLPPDDPAAHQYMRRVNGVRGWKHWYDHGLRPGLENEGWRESLPHYARLAEDGAVQLDVDSALQLAYVHSPNHQLQLETLFLSALDVTAERFRLDTQFFGGYDVAYEHNGSLIPAQLSFSPLLNRFVITPPIDGAGVENNRLTVGRPFATDPALLVQRRFATAGELLVGFANSFVFEFTGGDANLTASLVNFSFIQPLLRGAGKDVALEQLTFEERKLLANLRAYSQFRQGFYTQVAIGELGVAGPRRFGATTGLQSFSGQGGVGGYLGLLQQLQQVRNSDDNLQLQLRTLARLESLLEYDLIDLVQVDQFRQSVERERDALLGRRVALELALDRYKTGVLGLPPDLAVALDDALITQFQLVPREARDIQQAVIEFQTRAGALPDDVDEETVRRALSEAARVSEPLAAVLEIGRRDLVRMDEAAEQRVGRMSPADREEFQADRRELAGRLGDLQGSYQRLVDELAQLHAELDESTRTRTARRLISWSADLLELSERVALVPARARLESITVDSVDLESRQAYDLALVNRLDFMNGRAALVDRWRAIQFNADALQSVVNVTADGDLRTARNNPVSFRAPTASVRMGLEFDAPLTRLLERNAYRESLIEYQRGRREFIQSRDGLHLGLRALLRTLDQLEQSLEIQRRAVEIAIRRVDQTQLALNPRRQPPQPGQRPPINPTTAINLLGAQQSLRDSQDAMLGVWLSYYATKLRLYRELGAMQLDAHGRWIELPLAGSSRGVGCSGEGYTPEELFLPPEAPPEWSALPDLALPAAPENVGNGGRTDAEGSPVNQLPPPQKAGGGSGFEAPPL